MGGIIDWVRGRRTADQDDLYDLEDHAGQRASAMRRWLAIGVAALAVVSFGMIVSYGYYTYSGRLASAPVPLVTADPRPGKARPADPGGLQVLDKDKGVLGIGSGQGQRQADAGSTGREVLLPPPETPMPRPVAATQAPSAGPNTTGAGPGTNEGTRSNSAGATPATPTPATSAMALAIVPPPPPAPPVAAATAATTPRSDAALVGTAPPRGSNAAPTGVAAAEPASGAFRVQVAAMRTEAEARAAWEKLRVRHADVLGRMNASFSRVEFGERGAFFRVHAGPLAGPEAARDACARLTQAGTVCIVVPPS